MIADILSHLSGSLSLQIGQLAESGGVVMQLAPGAGIVRFMDGSAQRSFKVLLLSKHKNQMIALDSVDDAQRRAVSLPLRDLSNDQWQITGIECDTEPGYVTKDGDFWFYSAVLSVTYYDKQEVVTHE